MPLSKEQEYFKLLHKKTNNLNQEFIKLKNMKKTKANIDKMKMFIDMYLKTDDIDVIFDWISNETKKEGKKEIPKDFSAEVESIYKLYPSSCPIRQASLSKSKKDKVKINRLIGAYGYDNVKEAIERYIKESRTHNVYFKGFSTLLNNLDIENESVADKKVRESEEVVSYILNGKIEQCKRISVPSGGIILSNR